MAPNSSTKEPGLGLPLPTTAGAEDVLLAGAAFLAAMRAYLTPLFSFFSSNSDLGRRKGTESIFAQNHPAKERVHH